MSRWLWSTLCTVVFASQSFAYPFIIRIENNQKQPVLIQDGNKTVYQILPNTTGEFVVTEKSNYRIRYLQGNVSSLVAWAYDKPFDILSAECDTWTDQDRLHICHYTFEKTNSSLLGTPTYELGHGNVLYAGFQKKDFLESLKEFTGASNIFFHHLDPSTKAQQLQKKKMAQSKHSTTTTPYLL